MLSGAERAERPLITRIYLKIISPSPRGRGLGGGGEIRLNTTLNFLAAFLTPTLTLPVKGEGTYFEIGSSQVPWCFMLFAAYRKETRECLYFIGNGTAHNT